MKISEWLKHFEIDSLDSTGIDAVYSVAESKGYCRYRIAGLSLIFEIEVRNSLSPWDHPGEIFVLVKLSVDKNWARIDIQTCTDSNAWYSTRCRPLWNSLGVENYSTKSSRVQLGKSVSVIVEHCDIFHRNEQLRTFCGATHVWKRFEAMEENR